MHVDESATEPLVLANRPAPGLLHLILNRPARLNALTHDLLTLLRDVLEAAAEDESVRCVLLSGAGRAFCVGQDLNDRDPRKLEQMPDLEAVQIELFHPVITAMRTMQKPVIAAVHGIAAGAGSSIALAADIVIAAQSAKFIQSFAKVGLSVDAGGGWHLAKTLGSAHARALLMTGGTLSAEDAQTAGLIWQVATDEALEQEALTLATTFASGPTQALAAIKSSIAATESEPNLPSYLKREAELQGEVGRTADYPEGVLSFLEKRSAKFSGS